MTSLAALTGALSVFSALGAHASTGTLDYYVSSTTGSDSTGDGSIQHPWSTIGKAAASVSLGDSGTVVHVEPGTYTTVVDNTSSGRPGAYLTFLADTTPDRPWSVKIVTGGGSSDFPFRNDGSYVRIIGFDVTSTGKASEGILSFGHNNIIQGNQVFGVNPGCTSHGGDGIGDDESAANNAFIGNVVHNIGGYPKSQACQYVHGIYPSGAGDIVQNNIAYQNAGSGILFNHNSVGATIANNLSFANGNHGISISSGGGNGDGFVITNNIVRDNAMFGINVHSDANGADNQYRDNLFYGNKKGDYGLDNSRTTPPWTPPNSSGTLDTDPLLVDYQANGSGDYRLTAASPCVDAGTTLGAPATDYDGTARPQGAGIDIGPYEYS
jgi:hypothetical protein